MFNSVVAGCTEQLVCSVVQVGPQDSSEPSSEGAAPAPASSSASSSISMSCAKGTSRLYGSVCMKNSWFCNAGHAVVAIGLLENGEGQRSCAGTLKLWIGSWTSMNQG